MSCCKCCCKPKIIDTSAVVEQPKPPPIKPPPPPPPVEPPPPPPPPVEPPKEDKWLGTYLYIGSSSLDYLLRIDGIAASELPPTNDLAVVSVFSIYSEALQQADDFSLLFGRDNTDNKVVNIKAAAEETPFISSDFKKGDQSLTWNEIKAGVDLTFLTVEKDKYLDEKVYPTTEDDNFVRYYRYDVTHWDKTKYTTHLALDPSWRVNGVAARDFVADGVRNVEKGGKIWLVAETDIVGSRLVEITSDGPISFEYEQLGGNHPLTYQDKVQFRIANFEKYNVLARLDLG